MPDTRISSQLQARYTHASYLRWLRGALFREVHVHEVLLVDFPVDGVNLRDDHKQALDQLADAFNAADERRRRSERVWEEFSRPYVINPEEGYGLVDGAWPTELLEGVRQEEPAPSVMGLPTDDDEVLVRVQDGTNSFAATYGLYVRTPSTPFAFGVLRGGASQTGAEPNNVTLSSLRGHAVAHYLIEHHDIDPHFFDRVDAPGSSAPIVDAIADGLVDAELDVNRNARIVCTFAADLVLVLNEDDLKQRLDDHLHTLVENDLDQKEHVQAAMGAYLMGRHALRLAETMDFVGGEGPHPEWPDPKVPRSLITPMFQALAHGDPRDDTPTASWSRFLAANRQRAKLENAMARDGDTSGGLLAPWQRTLRMCGRRPELAHNLGLERVDESTYRERAPEAFVGFFDFFETTNDLQLKRHYDAVRPDFYWLSRTHAEYAQGRATRMTGRSPTLEWFLSAPDS